MRIVYENELGDVCIVVPNLASGLTLEQIAVKDVPAGVRFWFMSAENVPVDRSARAAWEIDFESLGKPSGVGGAGE